MNSVGYKTTSAAIVLLMLLSGCSSRGSDKPADSPGLTASATGSAALPDVPSDQESPSPGQDDSVGGDSVATEPGEAGYVLPETEPAGLDGTVEAGGATVSLSSLAAVDAVAGGVGEVSGPAIQIEVSITAGDQDVDLSGASVDVAYGDQETPAVLFTTADQAQDLPVKVEAGQTVKGVYVVAVPTESRDRIDVKVLVSTAAPVAVFRGSVD